MSLSAKLALGDWIHFDDEDHQVVGFSGPAIRLRSAAGQPQLILAGELLGAGDFQRLAEPPAVADKWHHIDRGALLDCVPEDERHRLHALEAHLLEVMYGYPEGQGEAERQPREGYDPDSTELTGRLVRKAAELGVTDRHLWRVFNAYRDNDLWGIVDKRKVRLRNPLAGLDPHIVKAILEQQAVEEQDSTAGLDRFINRVQRRLDERHGKGVVTLPADRTFRRRVAELLRGRHTFGPASTRRRIANQPPGTHGHFTATRPGEVVMLDTTRLDVLAYDPQADAAVSLELT